MFVLIFSTFHLVMILCFVYYSKHVRQRGEQDCASVAHYVRLHHHFVDNHDVSILCTTAPRLLARKNLLKFEMEQLCFTRVVAVCCS
jgi:hypothetical protein